MFLQLNWGLAVVFDFLAEIVSNFSVLINAESGLDGGGRTRGGRSQPRTTKDRGLHRPVPGTYQELRAENRGGAVRAEHDGERIAAWGGGAGMGSDPQGRTPGAADAERVLKDGFRVGSGAGG